MLTDRDGDCGRQEVNLFEDCDMPGCRKRIINVAIVKQKCLLIGDRNVKLIIKIIVINGV